MQCYHHDFHLQPSKNVVMFLIFVNCFYFCHIPVCWLVPVCICFLSLLSICLLSIFYPFLAEGRLSVGGWSMAPLARCRDPGKGTCTAAARLCASLFTCACFWRSMRKKLLWITHISSMSQAFVSHRDIALDACILTKVQALAAAFSGGGPMTHWETFAPGKSFIGFVDFLRQLWLHSLFCCCQNHSFAFSFPLWRYI